MTPSTLSLLLTATMMLSGCGKAPVDAAPTIPTAFTVPLHWDKDTKRYVGDDKYECYSFASANGKFDDMGFTLSLKCTENASDKHATAPSSTLTCAPNEHPEEEMPADLADNMPPNKVYKCAPDKAAAPETAGPYTIIPLPKIVKVEPPPATHHPSLPMPAPDRPKKKPRWTTEYWDLDTQQMVVSHETPECIKHGLCVENPDGTLSSTGGAYIAAPEALITTGTATATPLLVLATSSTEPIPACHHCPVPPPQPEKHIRHKKPYALKCAFDEVEEADVVFDRHGAPVFGNICAKKPAMTPQQFTDWMNENLPAQTVSHEAPDNTEICGSPGVCRPLTDADYMRLGIPKYPPDYKMPKGDQP